MNPIDWLASPSSCLKLNFDVSVRRGKNFIGIGVAIRDSSSKVVTTVLKPMLGNFSVDLGELLTLREGLLFAKRHNLVINSTEVINSAKVDVLSVASLLNYDVSFLGDALFIVLDIKAFVLMRG
ncbi:hypothetical protein LWI28_003095 [Acer negundo]|uniref:RNase H type-1 domain-containing protein n=1 Tax=Acer negundo TaxID=4023 RepID=A0AAD5JC52_ACENE|nr:hypothetical protein LWI28_003095 [Acer negundo]